MLDGRVAIMTLQEVLDMRSTMIAGNEQARMESQNSAVKQWLSSFDNLSEQERHQRQRAECPKSGRWLFQEESFDNWRNFNFCSTPMLWMTGIPGAGK